LSEAYDEFRRDALQQYDTLPYELNDLYKKYFVEVHLPSETDLDAARSSGRRKEVEAYANYIEERTNKKFDVVISNSFVRNSSGIVSIKRMDSLSESELRGKIFKNTDNKLVAYVNANSRDVVFVKIEKKTSKKLSIMVINEDNLVFQVFFDIGEGAFLDVFELYASLPGTGALVSPLQEFSVHKDSKMEFTMLNDGNAQSQLLNLSKGIIEENSEINLNFIYNGSGITKSVGFFDTQGKSSRINAAETIYGTREQKFDINTYVINSKERSYTRLETGAILDGGSYCLLKGYAKVERLTRGAFSRVNQRGIVLNDKAHVDALPDMSIDYSNEVSATHSAATSPIDKEALFYMESRGIPETQARKMFVASFITRYLSNIQNPSAKEIASSVILSRIENDDFGVINTVTPKGIWMTSTANK
jgi:Fe-S cluster assembly scaffold protein SufB